MSYLIHVIIMCERLNPLMILLKNTLKRSIRRMAIISEVWHTYFQTFIYGYQLSY